MLNEIELRLKFLQAQDTNESGELYTEAFEFFCMSTKL